MGLLELLILGIAIGTKLDMISLTSLNKLHVIAIFANIFRIPTDTRIILNLIS